VTRWYRIGGVRFYRRSLVEPSVEERAALAISGRALLRRPLEWPLPNRVPDFSHAHTDPGGTDIWGPGPYLKVPNQPIGEDWEPIDRVFCPWGYPPDRLRVSHSQVYLQLAAVEPARIDQATWEWRLTVEPWRQESRSGGRFGPCRSAL
jgi:hypothetical protein